MNFPDVKNKTVLIMGLGLLGRGLKDSIFFAKKGAKVIVTDLKTKQQLQTSVNKLKKYKNIKLVLGQHRYEDIDKADLIIRNADVPLSSKYLQYAFKKNKKLDMDESLFAKHCPCPIIGITGTRGKTTTTELIYQLLRQTKKNVYLAGNIMGKATLPLIDKVKKNDLVVLELSSWQLQGFGWAKISPQVAVFTNIYPDHLNRYKNMTEYFNDKKLIYKFQTNKDYLILNEEQKQIKNLADKTKAKVIFFTKQDVPKSWHLQIFGQHNLENIAAAIKVAKIFKIKSTDIKTVVENFTGVKHRLQKVKTVNQVTFINDTTSTTPIAGQKALSSFEQPIILLAGGAAKNLDLTKFAKNIAQNKNIKSVVLLDGSATQELKNLIIKFKGENKILGVFDNFKKAVQLAAKQAKPNDIVLLSPGCASFGMFVNEFDRGDQFIKIVSNLK